MAKAQTNEELMTINLRKWHLVLTGFLALLVPALSAVGSYYSRSAAMEAKVYDHKLEVERDFVKKSDFKDMRDKIDVIANDVSEMKGFLKGKR